MPSSQPKILVYYPKYAPKYADFLRSHGYQNVMAAATEEEALALLPEAEVIMAVKLQPEWLTRATSLKWLQGLFAGVDGWVASPFIRDDIIMTRMLDVFSVPMAEYTFAYLLMITKQIPRLMQYQQNQVWKPFRAGVLRGKTIGVAGLGSIGSEVVRKARAFDMTVYGLSRTGEHQDLVDNHFLPTQWMEFVRDLDILVLTLPLTDATHHIISKEILMAMKEKAIFVNVGRGQLVDEESLIAVMQTGHLEAAVLDVFEHEPLDAASPLWQMNNVFITPHLSGPTTVDAVGEFVLDNLRRYEKGDALLGVVNRKRGY